MKIFSLYETDNIVVEDPGLKRVISLKPKIVLKSHGRIRGKFANTKINTVERIINLLSCPGHRAKKHIIMTNRSSGKYSTNAMILLKAFKIIEEKTKQNPIQVLVDAVEKVSIREEVTRLKYGGISVPKAVDCSSYRRVNIAVKNICQGVIKVSRGNKKRIEMCLADELIMAARGDVNSHSMAKKGEIERVAASAR